jgi:hypothetical protein
MGPEKSSRGVHRDIQSRIRTLLDQPREQPRRDLEQTHLKTTRLQDVDDDDDAVNAGVVWSVGSGDRSAASHDDPEARACRLRKVATAVKELMERAD